jgi:hypothetical protein
MNGAADASSVVALIKCTKHVSLHWPLLEAALSIFIVGYFVKTIFSDGINKNKETAKSAES